MLLRLFQATLEIQSQHRAALVSPSQHTTGAALLPFQLVVFGVSCPRGAKAHQLGRDVGETPLQTPGTLLPHVAVGRERPVRTATSVRFFLIKSRLRKTKHSGCPG